MKKGIHPKINRIKVISISWAEFEVNAAIQGPLKVDTCHLDHKTYTGEVDVKVMKGRMEKFAERQKKINSLQSK